MRELKKRFSGLVALMLVAVLAFGHNVGAANRGASGDVELQVGDRLLNDMTGGAIEITNTDVVEEYKDYITFNAIQDNEYTRIELQGDHKPVYSSIVINSIPAGYKGFKWTKSDNYALAAIGVDKNNPLYKSEYYAYPGTITPVPNTYTVNFKDANGNIGSDPNVKFNPDGAAYTLDNAPTKPGHSLDWKIGDKVYPAEDGIPAEVLKPLSDGDSIDATATFTPNKVIVNYNANGGTGTMTADEYTYSDDAASSVKLKDNAFKKDGYKFVGWSTTADGKSVVTSVDTAYAKRETIIDVYAVWEKESDPDAPVTPATAASAIKDAAPGSTVTVDLSTVTKVPADVFETARGKDVKIVFDLGDGLKWTVNGKDITGTELTDIDLAVIVGDEAGSDIPVDVINEVTGERYTMRITLAHHGEFGFKATLTINLEAKNSGYYANLFYYNPTKKGLEYICSDTIRANGEVDLTFTHASDYVIIINDKDMKPVDDAPKTGDNTPVAVLFAMMVLAGAGFVLLRKNEK